MSESAVATPEIINIGVDEAGRGPLFGRVYAAAVVLDPNMDLSQLKDSKKFHSKRKIGAVADYIKTNALAWAVCFEEAAAIDEINIRRATFRAMHSCIRSLITQLKNPAANHKNTMLWIDGNDFEPFVTFSDEENKLCVWPHETVIGGDDSRKEISAASILAKTERDAYISELCAQRPELVERYALDKNQGYGTARHIQGIKEYGITELHRLSFTTKWRNTDDDIKN